MFEVGDKVVCIEAFIGSHIEYAKTQGKHVTYPVLNGIYTVRFQNNKIGVLLEEITNPKLRWKDGFAELGFTPKKFVKLSDLTEMEELLQEAKQILEMQIA